MLTSNAVTVLERRYLLRNDQGQIIETPDQLFQRVAAYIASVEVDKELWTDRFYRMMSALDFLPNSPTLMNAGKTALGLSACYVLPVPDDLGGIFDAIKAQALIHQGGGGTGFAFSRLRPQGDLVQSTKGQASGPISFMHVFNAATGAVVQGGTRRGANMAVLNIHHPDIAAFIDVKSDLTAMTNFNVSVGVTDVFMTALKNKSMYPLLHPTTGNTTALISAQAIWDRIVDRAWTTGEPGLLFLDRANNSRSNPVPSLGPLDATNPCGEQFLYDWDSCNLGSINLAHFVLNDSLDWDRLRDTIYDAMRFLDNVVSLNTVAIPQINALKDKIRRVGLGVMGWADLLFTLRIGYNTQEAIDLASEVAEFVDANANAASAQLADEKGCFPYWEDSIYGPGQPHERKQRNCTTTTIAPTGTISIIAGASGGIEPLFSLAFKRTIMDKDEMMEVNPYFQQAMQGEKISTEVQNNATNYAAQHGTLQGFDGLPAWMYSVFVTARDVSVDMHIAQQAAWQAHMANAVSKTINAPQSATRADISRAYQLAYDSGCKGVTVYRDGSRAEQPMSVGSSTAPSVAPNKESAWIGQIASPQGTIRICVGERHGQPWEVFVILGKAGSDVSAFAEGLGRMISVALRGGISVEAIIDQLRGIGGARSVGFGPHRVLSVPDALARLLADHYGTQADKAEGELCPECGNTTLVNTEGCKKCPCGYTAC